MGKPRQSKEQFIKSRQDARASQAKAAEAKRIQDEALARRNMNRTRLDLYRSKLQQPAQPGMATNAIGNAVGNQVIGGSGKSMSRPMQQESDQSIAEEANRRELKIKPNQPGMAANAIGNVQALQDGGLLFNDNVRSLNDVTAGMVPQMSNAPVTMQNVPYTEKSTPMREDTRFLTYKDGLSAFDPNKKEIPLVVSPEERKSQQAVAPVPYEDKYGGFGGSGKTVDELKQDKPPVPKPDKPAEKETESSLGALKALADAMKPKEELPATQYRAFSVNSNDDRTDSTEIKDVMSARREALMKMMGGR